MAAETIKLFLPKGEAQSLRTAELLNWTGKAVAGPRSELEDLLARDELEKSGVYFLMGLDSDSGKPAAYIGEAEIVRDRLKQHRDKEFWVHAIAFVSKDENLTKSHVRYLEGRLIQETQNVGRFIILNGQASGSKLPESDREGMETWLLRIRQLLPVLGCDILMPVIKPEKKSAFSEILTCKTSGVMARGQRTANGFVVYKDSEARPGNQPSAPNWIIRLRDKLIADGSMVKMDDKFRFTKDVEFASPSAAAAAIKGRATNGLTSWLTQAGLTLKEIEESVSNH